MEESHPDIGTVLYNYDKNGNRTSVARNGAVDYYGVDAADKLLWVNRGVNAQPTSGQANPYTRYTYDTNGRPTQRDRRYDGGTLEVFNFGWDGDGRLRSLVGSARTVKMIKLHRLGFFRELPHGDNDGPSLKELVREKSADSEEALAAYLENGLPLIACTGLVEDVLHPGSGVIGPPHVLTDGIWAWPADLAYYVRKYHVRLPDQFRDHVEANGWRVPAPDRVDLMQLEF